MNPLMLEWGNRALQFLIPLVAPQITDVLKGVVGLINRKIPSPLKPLLNGAIGGASTWLLGGDPALGVGIAHLFGKARETKKRNDLRGAVLVQK